jgi:hypothetical protein
MYYVFQNISVVVRTYNPSTQEAKAGGSGVQGQSGLHSEILPETK